MKTGFQIFHDGFECELTTLPTLGKRVVIMRPGKKAGVRKKTRRELLREEECEADDALRGETYLAYGPGVRSYGAPPAYGLDRSLAVPTEAWVPGPTPSSTSVTGPRFEELGQGGSASQQPPADQSTA
ncbi:hypothetical protein PInf_008407 [Phytophthora infestans]|nr:hypothetical protein PInf_008407 [Phytophthora infestans]